MPSPGEGQLITNPYDTNDVYHDYARFECEQLTVDFDPDRDPVTFGFPPGSSRLRDG